MHKRYEIEEIKTIWSEEEKYNNWLKIELLNCQAWNKLEVIPDQDLDYIQKNITYNLEDIYEIEKATKHDVIAFTRAVSKKMDHSSKKWIHYGLTSSDIVDTANAIAFKKSNQIIYNELINLKNSLIKVAKKHQYTYQIGRTHGVHAELISFGIKIIGWVDEINRHLKRFKLAAKDIEIGKISGAVGTFASVDPFIQEYICTKLELGSARFSTQVISRDIHSFYFDTLNNISLSIKKFAIELRNLNRTEINETNEYFDLNQKGSSAMPHKKNPIGLENICGLSKLISGYALVANQNVDLWHERDLSHSSNERIIFFDAINAIVYILRRFNKIVNNLKINEEEMAENIKISKNKIFSGTILNELIKKTSYSREQIYDVIQEITKKCYENNLDFIEEFSKHELAKQITNLKQFFSYKNQLKHVDYIFKKVIYNEK